MNKTLTGIAQGLGAALLLQAGVLALRRETAPRPAPPLDERRGAIREVEIHYVPGQDFAREIYRDFFRRLPAEVRVLVACERREDFDDFVRRTGRDAVPIVMGHPITTWARDRFVACVDDVIVIPPEPHAGGKARWNDSLVPPVIARSEGFSLRTAPFRFDGGDFCMAGGRVLATSAWAARNPDRTSDQLVRAAEALFGRPMVYLPGAPDHHIGMVLAPVAENTVLVGDMREGMRLRPRDLEVDESVAERFDSVADSLRRAGYRVERIPVIVTPQDYAWITYTNAIFDERVVYLPVFGLAALDSAAAETYRRLGFEVRPVDVSGSWRHGGTLHCLIHVTRRE